MAQSSMWSRGRDAWRYVTALEPARVRAIVGSVLTLAVTAGLVLPDWLPGRIDAVIVAAFTVVTMVSAGEGTRRRVTPVARMDADVQQPAVSPPPEGQDTSWGHVSE